MKPLVQKILTPFGKELKPDKWVFIIGSYNSGTTLLASILREHSDIGGLPTEGVYLSDSLPYPEKFGWPRMWSKCIKKILISDDDANSRLAIRIKKQWSLWFPKNKKVLIEKSIANSVRLRFLQKYFQPAYFIYIVRNGYAVSAGIRKKANLKRWNNQYKDSAYPIELCAQQWRMTDQLVEKERDVIQNIIFVKYEDLTNDPVNEIGKILAFLELDELDSDLINGDWSVHEYTKKISNMNKGNFKLLSASDISKVKSIASDVLNKYEYTISDDE